MKIDIHISVDDPASLKELMSQIGSNIDVSEINICRASSTVTLKRGAAISDRTWVDYTGERNEWMVYKREGYMWEKQILHYGFFTEKPIETVTVPNGVFTPTDIWANVPNYGASVPVFPSKVK